MKRSKERDRESEKAPQPSKLDVICPLIFKLAKLAVNYDLTWQPETKLTVTDDDGFVTSEVTGVWKSNPVQRGHTEVFLAELQKMRESGTISWNETAYYFTHEEGIEARKAYEAEVLEGRLKAHITSWGPNPAKANDKSRFHKYTGVTFEELKQKYPALYEKKQAVAVAVPRQRDAEKTEVAEPKEEVEVITSTEVSEPSDNELTKIEEEQKVAAAVATDTTLEDLIKDGESDEESDDHNVIVLTIEEGDIVERIDPQHESIGWKTTDGREMVAYLHELPELGTELWLPEGEWEINGVKYSVRVSK